MGMVTKKTEGWVNQNNMIAWKGFETTDPPPPGAYHVGRDDFFGLFVTPAKNSTDKLFFDDNHQSAQIFKELTTFLDSAEAYENYGFNHQRGFLLHGAPGVGKSATIAHMTEMFSSRGGYTLIGVNGATRECIQMFRQWNPKAQFMIVIEDIENWTGGHESNLLSMLDGQTKTPGVVYVATTNYLDQVSHRMTRAGRFDTHIEVLPCSQQVRFMYLKSRGVSEVQARTIASCTNNLSISAVKEVLLSHCVYGHSLEASVRKAQGLDSSREPEAASQADKLLNKVFGISRSDIAPSAVREDPAGSIELEEGDVDQMNTQGACS